MKFLSVLRKPAIIKRKNSVAATEVSESNSSRSNSGSTSPRIPSTPVSLAQSTNSSISQINFQEISEDVILSSIPMMKIITSQIDKIYYESDNEINWICTVPEQEDRRIMKIALIGTNIFLDLEDQTRTSISIIKKFSMESNLILLEDSINFIDPEVRISSSSSGNDITILQKIIALSIFEHFAVYKSLTGSLISSIGLRMPDINMILNSQFNFKDWCDIYIPEEGWVRSWCHINKMSKRSDKYDPKGKYQIKFYRTNKSNSPNSNTNLICYIPDSNHVQDIFFYNGEANEQTPIANPTNFLNNIKLIKLIGDVLYPEETPSLRSTSTSSSITKQLISPKRDVSTKAVKPSKSSNFKTHKDGLLMRPIPHHGLSHFDAMIKFIIPMMDITRKYGRPKQFNASINESNSLMFGLPKLPNTNYLKQSEIDQLIRDTPMEDVTNDEIFSYSMNWIGNFLKETYQTDPERAS